MLRRSFAVGFALVAAAALLLPLVLGGNAEHRALGQAPEGVPPIQFVVGDAALVEESVVVSWARVHQDHGVKEVGVTIPVALFDNQPEEGGDGPAGAIASLAFPEVVQNTTYFNHFELHTNPHGHPTAPGSVNPDRNRVPHFDFHYYAIPEELVWEIPFAAPPLPAVAADRLPPGYIQPGISEPQMGRHSAPAWTLLDPGFLTTVMIAGFLPDGSDMHFIEPMVSRERLLERTDFELELPAPAVLGRSTLYPTKFAAEYDADLDAYHFVFSEFVEVE